MAGLVLVTFLMVRLIPGDPAIIIAGDLGDEEYIAKIRSELGLDRPVLEQLAVYVDRVLHFDFGSSFQTGQPVAHIIAVKSGASISLAVAAFVLVMLVSVPVGFVSAALTQEGRHQRLEVLFTSSTSVVGALPEYLAATFLAFVFAVWLRVLPVGGSDTPQSLVLPAIAVAIRPAALLARIVRVETLNVLTLDYVRMVRSKRLPSRIVYFRHALPNVITSTLTIGGLLLAGIVGGAVIVEAVFVRPGLGTTIIQAVHERDYPVIQGVMLVLGFTVIAVNTVVDVIVAVLNPRSLTADA